MCFDSTKLTKYMTNSYGIFHMNIQNESHEKKKIMIFSWVQRKPRTTTLQWYIQKANKMERRKKIITAYPTNQKEKKYVMYISLWSVYILVSRHNIPSTRLFCLLSCCFYFHFHFAFVAIFDIMNKKKAKIKKNRQ